MKYIPADKLIAEIERLLARANRRTDKEHLSHNSEMEKFGEDYWNGYGDLAYSLLGFIISLQQEQPKMNFEDFDKEFAKFSNDPDAMDYAFPIDLADYKDFARHFYELGLNARKEVQP